jgi:hypothetical protein
MTKICLVSGRTRRSAPYDLTCLTLTVGAASYYAKASKRQVLRPYFSDLSLASLSLLPHPGHPATRTSCLPRWGISPSRGAEDGACPPKRLRRRRLSHPGHPATRTSCAQTALVRLDLWRRVACLTAVRFYPKSAQTRIVR